MESYMIVCEDKKHGTWWGEPNAFPTEAEAIEWAKTERKPPRGYAWMIYKISFQREATEISKAA